MQGLSKAPYPPYFLEYRVEDFKYVDVQASFGSLIRSTADSSRTLVTRVKVGDYEIDNTHPFTGNQNYYDEGGSYAMPVPFPIEDDPLAIQHTLWSSTKENYSAAVNAYKRLMSSATKPSKSKLTPDFSREEPSVYMEAALAPLTVLVDRKEWEERVKKYSGVFLRNKDIVSGEVSFNFSINRQYLVTNEGTRIAQNLTYAYINVSAEIRTMDGDLVPLHLSYFNFLPKDLPSDEKILAEIDVLITKLDKLKTAPLAEPYTGPAILHAQAAGVFFHEIFGHRVEGHRLRSEFDGQTFRSKVNELVLPKTMSVSFDPTLTHYQNKPLNGYFKYDDEGIKARRVNVVEGGILKTFLMSRTPLDGILKSNGHGRAAAEAEVVSRQSNLIVETQKQVNMDELRKLLIKECQRQGKKYGYLFKDVIGGFTFTNRFTPNAFNIFPTEVYRVYTDGRPDELVRGVDLIGTPLAMFAEIVAAGNDPDVFTGFCGAESGNVPVSAISPSLFVRRIETQKKLKKKEESTILPRPTTDQQ